MCIWNRFEPANEKRRFDSGQCGRVKHWCKRRKLIPFFDPFDTFYTAKDYFGLNVPVQTIVSPLIWCKLRLSNKLLEQGYVKERLKELRKFYGRYGDRIKQYEVSLSQMLNDILWPDHIQWQPFTDKTLYRTRPFTEFWEVPIEHLRRVWHDDRGRLLLRTSGPAPLGLAYNRTCQLRIELVSLNNVAAHAVYTNFSISDESDGYRLVYGDYSGNAGKVFYSFVVFYILSLTCSKGETRYQTRQYGGYR